MRIALALMNSVPPGVRAASGPDIGTEAKTPASRGEGQQSNTISDVPALNPLLCRADAFPTVMLLTWPLR
jgi:hypothetical protein